MIRVRYIPALSVAILMIGLSAGVVLGADRRDGGPGDRRDGRRDLDQPSRLRILLHARASPPLRDEDRRPVVRRHPLRDRDDFRRYGGLHYVHHHGRTVYYLSFGYSRPPYYAGLYYDYLPAPRRDTDVNVYVLPRQEPDRQQEYTVLEPKAQDTQKEAEDASELSPKLGGPETVSLEFALAEEALKHGMFGLAVQDFRKLALDSPDDPVPMLALGLTLFARDDLEDAAAALRAALAVLPDPEAIKLDEPLVFGSGGTYDLRIQEVAAGLEEHPDNADLQFLMGLHYFSGGDFPQAVEHLGKAEALDPADVASARLRALSTGHVAEAEKAAANPAGPAQATTE